MSRPIHEIAQEIKQDWAKPYFGAVPYLRAMESLSDPDGWYSQDRATYILMYFLGNANSWRGETARRVKAEIRQIIKESG